MADYQILFCSKDAKARNSVLGRKQKAIINAVVKGGGQITARQVAEIATEKIGEEDTKVNPSEVSLFLKEFKEQYPDDSAGLPAVKKGKKGKTKMVAAGAGEVQSFMARLLAGDADDSEDETEGE